MQAWRVVVVQRLGKWALIGKQSANAVAHCRFAILGRYAVNSVSTVTLERAAGHQLAA